MNAEEFREFGKASIDYIADYLENIRDKPVISLSEPGFLQNTIPETVPEFGESWKTVLKDVDELIVPGLTHWHSPHFHAFFPTANSYPAIVGELMLSGIGAVSKDWTSNPACVELETRMMDWLGKMLGLPEVFLNSSKGHGGGVIQNAASESTLVAVLAGMAKAIQNRISIDASIPEQDIRKKLVAYTSMHSNSSVEKAGLLASVPMRLLQTDKNGSLRGYILEEAIKKDKARGLIPCCVVATLGTTGTCSFDNLEEIAEVTTKEDVWLHVDAAYAGSALCCPEYRYLIKGIEGVDSFCFNPHKWMLVSSDCSAMWFKDTRFFQKTYKSTVNIPLVDEDDWDLKVEHWQIPDTRRFRALKLWFVLRIYGVEGIQQYIREQIGLAKLFEELVKNDGRFEVTSSNMGLVCFRVRGDESLTKELLRKITERNKIFLIPYFHQDKPIIRFVICSRYTNEKDIEFAWKEIESQTDAILSANDIVCV